MKKFRIYIFVLITSLSVFSCEFLQLLQPTTTTATTKEDATTQLRKDVAQSSKQYVGTKYKYAGKTPKTGFDCSGFTSYVYEQFELELSSSSSAQATQGKEVPLSDVKAGDLVFFGKKGRITHVAMVISNTKEGINVIHSTTSKGVMIQNISTSKYWKPKIMFARDVISTR